MWQFAVQISQRSGEQHVWCRRIGHQARNELTVIVFLVLCDDPGQQWVFTFRIRLDGSGHRRIEI